MAGFFVFMEYKYWQHVRVPKYVFSQRKYNTHNINLLVDIVEESLPVFRSMVDFDDQLLITLKPMRGKTKGIYDPNVCMVESEYRYDDVFLFLTVIAHELVHAEQYHTGRFDSEWRGTDYLYRWYDTYYSIIERDYNKYLPPWEQEAYERQEGLALAVCSELGL